MSVKARLWSLFSVARLYNGFLVVLAQYLSAIYIFGRSFSVADLLLNKDLHLLVGASLLVVSAGYLINQYYDLPKDLINRPIKTMVGLQRSPSSLMRWSALLISIALLLSTLVSFLASLYFLGYFLTIWLYSHRLRSIPLWGSLLSAFLSVSPIAVLFLYYRYFDVTILAFAFFLFVLLWIITLIKDLENLPGDIAVGLRTLATTWGAKKNRRLIQILLTFELLLSTLILYSFELSQMRYYFYFASVSFMMLMVALSFNERQNVYSQIHWFLKFLVFMGVAGILFFDLSRLSELKALIFAL
jgi:4-hydroxybenzoate polyprenyltransferase